MKNKKKTIMLIMIITISMVLLSWNKSYSYQMNDNEPEEKEIERKEFGIYYQIENDRYEEQTEFPKQGYLLNEELTKCYEYGNNTEIPRAVEQSLTNGVIDGSIIVQSTKSMYCKIYFDKDETPIVSSFNIKGKTSVGAGLNNGFTYQTSNLPITIEYIDKESNVVQYCINETNNSDSCSWKQLNGKSDIYTLTNTADGEKTLYMYLKDKANNISEVKTGNITVDQTSPQVALGLTGTSINPFVATSGYTHTQQVTYNATITETNPDSYCVGENTCSNYSSLSSSSISGSTTIANTETLHTVIINIKDKAGNTGSTTQSITLDLYNPAISLTQGIVTENSITVNVAINDTHNIDNVTCTAVGNNEAKTGTYTNNACTFSGLNDDTLYSITVEAMDVSGRKGTGQIRVTTVKGKLTRENIPSKLFNNVNPKGLSDTLLGDMYRFVGLCFDGAAGKPNDCDGKVENFVCFGYDDPSQCVKSSGNKLDLNNEYLYRIIGITTDGQMKLIKNREVIESTEYGYYGFEWNNVTTNDINWPETDIYKRINGLSNGLNKGYQGDTNLFINSTTSNVKYLTIGNNWYSKIDNNHEWLYGGIYGNNLNQSADNIYKIESGQSETVQSYGESPSRWSKKVKAAVGLMYVSDYYYSFAASGTNSSNSNCYNSSSCGKSWLNLGGGYDWFREWTMTRSGRSEDEGEYQSWTILSYGKMEKIRVDTFHYIRPVFYLNSDVKISSGTGTSSSPFIVAA